LKVSVGTFVLKASVGTFVLKVSVGTFVLKVSVPRYFYFESISRYFCLRNKSLSPKGEFVNNLLFAVQFLEILLSCGTVS
jgi:hypothetical protein